MATNLLRVDAVRIAKVTHPTGDPTFAVKQSFPAAFDEVESDPFLMCDYFSDKSPGLASHADSFPISWHPHRGMDICTYMKEGVGRHGDSLGHRELYSTPGMQWISVGSGIIHAEDGGTPKGHVRSGFQIWINVPAKHKMDDPQYGTVDPKTLPLLQLNEGHVRARVLAGLYHNAQGPFCTKQPLQMVDYELDIAQHHLHSVPADLDNCLVFVYEGSGTINGQAVRPFSVIRLLCDVTEGASAEVAYRQVEIVSSGGEKMSAVVFAGKKIREPIAWHGPFVMNTQEEIHQTLAEYRSGNFPPKRVLWDFTRLSEFPAQKRESIVTNEKQFHDEQSLQRTNCL